MSAVSLPVTRPSGFALLVGSPTSRTEPLAILSDLGYGCDEADDPYSAFLELCQRPLAFNAVILSLASIYREELQMIPAIRRKFPHLEIWLAQADGRHSIMAEAIRLGADGLLSEDGMLRIGLPPSSTDVAASIDPTPRLSQESDAELERINGFSHPAGESDQGTNIFADEIAVGEPVLTADELRALLRATLGAKPLAGRALIMVRMSSERILLIGDSNRQFHAALSQAIPGAQITSVATIFDGIGELSTNASYGAVLAAAEPIERRPEPAVRALRELSHNSRLLLFGHPTLEILSRKMLQYGCDDYIISPPNPSELAHIFDNSPMRMVPVDRKQTPPPPAIRFGAEPAPAPAIRTLADLPLADIFLEAMQQSPNDAPTAALKAINAKIAPSLEVKFTATSAPPMEVPPGRSAFSLGVRAANEDAGTLDLLSNTPDDDRDVRHIFSHIAQLFGNVIALQDRHNRLQKLAIADDLTGLYNARYFRHFLTRIVERAKAMRFPVTLLLFDIDDFKKYNDQYGHGVGDEILKQTAQMIRRCCREHDLVARIGGDEFAVVFWDKEGPRHPLDPNKKSTGPSRPPQTPVQIFERFKRLAASSDFSGLGASGRGKLSCSGGLAVYPYDAQDVPGLIKAADDYLMFKAKKAGKNSIYLVEGREQKAP